MLLSTQHVEVCKAPREMVMGKIILQQWIAMASHKKGSALGPLRCRGLQAYQLVAMRAQGRQSRPQPSVVGLQVTSHSQAAPQGPRHLLLKARGRQGKPPFSPEIRSPEEALAAFAGHGVEVKARGSVPTDPTDSGHVPVELAGWVGKRRAGSHGLHVWGSRGRQVFISSCHSFTKS